MCTDSFSLFHHLSLLCFQYAQPHVHLSSFFYLDAPDILLNIVLMRCVLVTCLFVFFSSLGILCLFSSSSVVVLQSLLIICCVFVFFVSYMPFCFSYSIFFSVLAAAFFLFNCNHNRGSHCSRLLCDPRLYILCFVFTLFVFVKLFDLIWQKSNKACTKSLFILDEFKEFLHQSIREALNSGSAVIRSLH